MDMNGLAETFAANHLFRVQEDGSNLSMQQYEIYRMIVAKILFVSCQSWPDINTYIELLTNMVKQPNIYKYKNLERCIRCIRSKLKITLVLQ